MLQRPSTTGVTVAAVVFLRIIKFRMNDDNMYSLYNRERLHLYQFTNTTSIYFISSFVVESYPTLVAHICNVDAERIRVDAGS